jgi:hypothetical protein
MAETDTRKKALSGYENPAIPQTISPNITAPVQAATTTPLPPEVRDELTSLMQELLLKTHELSFEYSTLECDKIKDCPLAIKSRELFRTVKQLNNLVRKMQSQQQPTYVK